MRRYGRYNNQGTGLAMLLIVVVLAVFSGYMGTKFIIEPYFLADRGTTPDTQSPTETGEQTEQQNPDGIVTGEQNITDLPTEGSNETAPTATVDEPTGTDAGQPEPPEVQSQNDASLVTPEVSGDTVPTISPTAGDTLYCIQFGSFSSQEAAEKAVKELTEKDVATYVQPKDDSFKVLSPPYESREKAQEAAAAIRDRVEDVYVVAL